MIPDFRTNYEDYIQYMSLQMWLDYFAQRITAKILSGPQKNVFCPLAEYVSKMGRPKNTEDLLCNTVNVMRHLGSGLALTHDIKQELPCFRKVKEYKCLAKYETVIQAISDVCSTYRHQKRKRRAFCSCEVRIGRWWRVGSDKTDS